MKQLIANIIATRNQRVDKIKEKINFLHKLQNDLTQYNALRNQIVSSEGELLEGSPFTSLLLRHPEMVNSIYYATTKDLEEAIRGQLEKLERLQKRFSRNSLSLQVFGLAGSGKSTFIQSVSGLDDEVVLTSSGDHCTGVSSFIYNAANFRAEVYFYSRQELLDIFNKALIQLQKSRGKEAKPISLFEQIASFNPEEYNLSIDDYETKHLLQYTHNYDTLAKLTDMPMLTIIDKSQVKQYVAQHDGTKSSDPKHVRYNNYLAVKYVNIYHPFNYSDAGQIVLMDTVGLGDTVNDVSTEQNMYQAIADSSDVVILLYSPKPQGGWRGDEAALCHRLDNLRFVDKERQVGRIHPETLFFLLNERNTSEMNNQSDCEEMRRKFKDELLRKETILIADLHDRNQSVTKAIVPILSQITEHIAEIDEDLISGVEQSGKTVYAQFSSLLKNISSVLVSAPDTDNAIGFNKLFDDLFNRDMKDHMLTVLEKAKQNRALPSEDLKICLKKLSNSDSIVGYLKDVTPIVQQGITYHKDFPAIYSEAAITLRHAIPEHFRQIDIDLRKQVEERKEDVLKVLADTGHLTTLIKKDETTSYSIWMQKLLDTLVDESDYPKFYKCVRDLLDFTIDINGILLYRIIKHLNNFDDFNIAQVVDKNEIPQMIDYYLRTHLRDAFDSIQQELTDFTTIPNESIYYCVEAFYLNLCLYPECAEELYKLYYRHRHRVWRNEFEETQATTVAFKAWQQVRDSLEKYDEESKFCNVK